MPEELAKTVETAPSYGDLSELNTSRLVLESVGRDALVQMAGDLLEMLQTSCAVYEKNGDYALGVFSSHWCRFLDEASRKLCGTDDNQEALQCGKWLCHESCWRGASQVAIEAGQPTDVECSGGIHIYAVPIKAGEEIVGSINFGYGDPPKEPTRLREIAAKYQVTVDELWEQAHEYESRPEFVIDLARKHLMTSAKLIGEIVERKRAEDAAEASEEQYRTLIQSVHDGVYRLDLEGRFTFVNDLIVKRSGRAREWFIGRSFLDVIVPEDRQRMQEIFAAAMRGQTPQPYETAYRRASGDVLHIEVNSTPLFEGDEVVSLLSVSRDITERKRADEALKRSRHELDIRNRIAEIFLTVPDEEVYADVLQVVLEAMGSKYGVFGYVDEEGALVVPSMTRHIWDKCQVQDKKIVYPRETWGDSIWPRAIREKRTLYSNEPSTLTPEGHVPITRNVVVPMIHAGDVVGLFHVANKETDYTDEDIRLLETIGGAVAPVLNARLQRDRAEKNLRLSATRWKNTFDAVEDMIAVIDTDYRIVLANRAMKATFKDQAVVGAFCYELIHATDRPPETCRACQVFQTGEPVQWELQEKHLGGCWLSITSSPIKDEAGKVQQVVHSVRDITDRKQATNALKESIASLQEMVNLMADGPGAGGSQ